MRHLVRTYLPAWLRYLLTVLLFWPTVLLARLLSWLAPSWRRQYDRVHARVVLGAAPVLAADVRRLAREEGVVAVVNLCREWVAHRELYAALQLQALHLPTIDFDVPALDYLLRGAAFVARHARAGRSVYVHCKAGRGRSTCVVLAYYALFEGVEPSAAHARIAAARPHISRKWDAPEVLRCWQLRRALDAAGDGVAQAFLAAAAAGRQAVVEGVASTSDGDIVLLSE